MILHCMKESLWKQRENQGSWGQEELERDGFIHCSAADFFWRVVPNFAEVTEPLVLLCIDEDELQSEIRYEDGGEGRLYPHIYGLVNREAVVQVLPYRRDAAGRWIKNPELAHIADR